jgi:hypothetical protein
VEARALVLEGTSPRNLLAQLRRSIVECTRRSRGSPDLNRLNAGCGCSVTVRRTACSRDGYPTTQGVTSPDTYQHDLPEGTGTDSRWIDIHEHDELDVAQMATLVKQAAALPGWVP